MTRETSRTAAHDGREAGHDTSIAVPPSGNPDGCLCPVRPPVLHGPALLMPGAIKARTIARLFVLATRTWRERTGKASHSSRSEEHTSELQSLMRISYAVFCLKKKKQTNKSNEQKNTYQTH